MQQAELRPPPALGGVRAAGWTEVDEALGIGLGTELGTEPNLPPWVLEIVDLCRGANAADGKGAMRVAATVFLENVFGCCRSKTPARNLPVVSDFDNLRVLSRKRNLYSMAQLLAGPGKCLAGIPDPRNDAAIGESGNAHTRGCIMSIVAE